LFDFNYSRQIGGLGYGGGQNDVKGVVFALYEIITRDTDFRNVDHPADVEWLEEWVQHPAVKLDHPVSEYRSVLDEWVKGRREGKQISVYTEAPEHLEWPDFPKPPPPEEELILLGDGCGNSTVAKGVTMYEIRRYERENGRQILNWERPAQKKLWKGDRVFANGQLVSSRECPGLDGPNS
jgi:hypothetical protein